MSEPVEVVVVDAGVGNLGNLRRALEWAGARVEVTSDPERVRRARRLVLPGVGAFRPPRERLRGALEETLREALAAGATLLGVCVGFQLLFEESEEHGRCDGLGLLPGRVTKLPGGVGVRLPHIGWSALEISPHSHSACELLVAASDPDSSSSFRPDPGSRIPDPDRVGHPLADAPAYFVHSYAPEGVPEELILATAFHGRVFPAIVGRGRVVGTQFHPEKSGAMGLRLLSAFLAISPASGREVAGFASVSGLRADPGSRIPDPDTPSTPTPFTVLPAIDLRHGKVVRLRHGRDDRATVYGDDPVAVLARYRDAGATMVHVVDLDAAFGQAPQTALIAALAALPGRPALQVGGGLRDGESIAAMLELGVERAVVGSLVARDPARVAELARQHPGRLVAGLDAREGRVAIDGWREQGGDVRELAAGLRGLPLAALLVTDVARDGALGGANHELPVELARAAGIPALLSGGIDSLADLRAGARRPELAGAIVGTALYEGRFELRAALGAGRRSRLAARVLPCLDIAAGRVVKGVRFANLRDLGDPAAAAQRYAAEGADEIVFLDVAATVEARQARREWIQAVAERVFVPLTVGGGVGSVEDARELLRAGADKVAVNSAAVARPELIRELAEVFGSQCVVLSVDARRRPVAESDSPSDPLPTPHSPLPQWQVVTHGGRRPAGLDALEFIERGVELGAGEVLLTSIDSDGTRDGYDLELVRAVTSRVTVPVIASGGAGRIEHLAAALEAGADAVLAASIFHEGDWSVDAVKEQLAAGGIEVRRGKGKGSGEWGSSEESVGGKEIGNGEWGSSEGNVGVTDEGVLVDER